MKISNAGNDKNQISNFSYSTYFCEVKKAALKLCTFIIACTACTSFSLTNVNLSGKVTRQGAGTLDVVITLLSAGISDTTDTSGSYKLFRQGTSIGKQHTQSGSTGETTNKILLCANGVMPLRGETGIAHLYNMQGRIIHQSVTSQGNIHTPLQNGIYFHKSMNAGVRTITATSASTIADTLSLSYQGAVIKKIPVEKLDGSLNIALDSDLPERKHSVLVASYSNSKAYILSADNKVEWEYAMPGSVQDAWVLPNGNILLSGGSDVREVTRSKEVVWKYSASAGEIHNCEPLPGNVVLFGENSSGKLFEINRTTNKVVRTIQTACKGDNHTRFRMVRKTKDSTYMIAARGENNLYELSQEGKILRTIYCDSLKKKYGINWDALHSALKLDNGNILIGGGYNSVFIEVDKKDSIVWKLSASDIPEIGFTFAAAGQLLPGGTFIFGAYTSSYKLVEITRSKKVIWKLKNSTIGDPTHIYVMDCWENSSQACKPAAPETLVR